MLECLKKIKAACCCCFKRKPKGLPVTASSVPGSTQAGTQGLAMHSSIDVKTAGRLITPTISNESLGEDRTTTLPAAEAPKTFVVVTLVEPIHLKEPNPIAVAESSRSSGFSESSHSSGDSAPPPPLLSALPPPISASAPAVELRSPMVSPRQSSPSSGLPAVGGLSLQDSEEQMKAIANEIDPKDKQETVLTFMRDSAKLKEVDPEDKQETVFTFMRDSAKLKMRDTEALPGVPSSPNIHVSMLPVGLRVFTRASS